MTRRHFGRLITPLGADLDAFWTALVTGADGISSIDRFPVGDLRVQRGGEIKKLAGAESRPRGGRATQLLQAAAADLCARFRLDVPPARLAVVVGTALGGVEEGDRALAGERVRGGPASALYDTPARALARFLGAKYRLSPWGAPVPQEPRPSGSVPICSATTAPIS